MFDPVQGVGSNTEPMYEKAGTVESPFQVSCIVMASGFGDRFGSNKLLADFNGKPLILHILEQVPFDLFHEVIVVTRYEEVKELLKDYPVTCILHDLPRQSDTIKIGMNHISKTQGCMFVTCDQPLRTKDSISRLIATFQKERDRIVRLGHDSFIGNPVIFPKKYYEELRNLQPEEKGGTVIKCHADSVIVVQANHSYELADVDTKEDLAHLLHIVNQLKSSY